MAKQRHSSQQAEPASSRTTLAFLAIGALVVAGLVVWALTRTVQAPSPVATYTADASTSASSSTAYDTTGFNATPPLQTPPPDSPIASSTAGMVTSSHAPMIEGSKAEVQRISAEDLREKVTAHAVTVIDVRDQSAFESAHIPGSLHIPLASIEANLDRLPKGKPIVAYCT